MQNNIFIGNINLVQFFWLLKTRLRETISNMSFRKLRFIHDDFLCLWIMIALWTMFATDPNFWLSPRFLSRHLVCVILKVNHNVRMRVSRERLSLARISPYSVYKLWYKRIHWNVSNCSKRVSNFVKNIRKSYSV